MDANHQERKQRHLQNDGTTAMFEPQAKRPSLTERFPKMQRPGQSIVG